MLTLFGGEYCRFDKKKEEKGNGKKNVNRERFLYGKKNLKKKTFLLRSYGQFYLVYLVNTEGTFDRGCTGQNHKFYYIFPENCCGRDFTSVSTVWIVILRSGVFVYICIKEHYTF